MAGALVANLGKAAALFSKTMVDLEPLDFPRIFDKNVGSLTGLKSSMVAIPSNWDAAFGRALLVLGGEVDKSTKVTCSGENLKLVSTSPMGDADDAMPFDQDDSSDGPVYVDPALVVRASKSCALLRITDKVMIMADADAQFLHLIAHCAK